MASTCTHISSANLRPPTLSQSVHREECTQCFDSQDLADGVDVCLICFNGGCPRVHAALHVHKSNHPYTVNIKRVKKPTPKSGRGDDEPPAKITKLEIKAERDEDKYDHITTLKCWKCDPIHGKPLPPNDALIAPILSSNSSAQQSEIKAWEEEIHPCEHTLLLSPSPSGPIAASGLAHCTSCSLTQNLWLCLTCGSLGCGRAQFGGVEGNSHALSHSTSTKHPVAVKLGTITPEGTADLYCYTCNDSVIDPNVEDHLACFGIRVEGLKKTEKSMTELNIDQNLSYDFSLTSQSGKDLVPVHGPGLTGLANLGNTCYIASVLQVLFSIKEWEGRWFSGANQNQDQDHAERCTVPLPADCLECQLRKVADGLLSGRYSSPVGVTSSGPAFPISSSASPAPPLSSSANAPPDSTQLPAQFQQGVRPSSFKSLIGKSHPEFSTMRQQDAEEFLGHLLSVVRREGRKTGEVGGESDPTRIFTFSTSQRLQCTSCNKVRYRNDNMDVLSVGVPAREKASSSTGTAATSTTTTSKEGGEVMDVDIDQPKVQPQAGSEKDKQKKAEEKKEYEPVTLQECIDGVLGNELLEYNCPECKKGVGAVKQTKFASLPDVLVIHAKKFQLVNWVPAKLDIPVILPANQTLTFNASQFSTGLQPGESPLPEDSSSSGTSSTSGGGGAQQLPEFDPMILSSLEGMGFPLVRCQKALLATGNSTAEAAMEWLFSHMDDEGIDDPIRLGGSAGGLGGGGGGGAVVDREQVAMLVDMGFTEKQASKALRETSNNTERAVEWLFSHPDDAGEDAPAPVSSSAEPSTSTSTGAALPGHTTTPAKYTLFAFISHKGPSMHSGHYVAHIRKGGAGKGGEWVLFNDEKVVLAEGGVATSVESTSETTAGGGAEVAASVVGGEINEKAKDGDSVDELMKKAYLYFWVRT